MGKFAFFVMFNRMRAGSPSAPPQKSDSEHWCCSLWNGPRQGFLRHFLRGTDTYVNKTGQTKTHFFRLDHTFYESFCINGIAIKAIPNRFNVICSLYVCMVNIIYLFSINILVFNIIYLFSMFNVAKTCADS